MKPVLCFHRRKRMQLRLFPEDELEFGDNVDDDLRVGSKSRHEPFFPGAELRFAQREQIANQFLDCLRNGCIRHVVLELLKLTADEQPPILEDGLVHLIHK